MNQNSIFKYILKDHKDEIDNHLGCILNRNYVEFHNIESVKRVFNNHLTNLDESLNYDDYLDIRKYTGYSYKWINSVLRGYWDYDLLGRKTEKLEQDIKRYEKKYQNLYVLKVI